MPFADVIAIARRIEESETLSAIGGALRDIGRGWGYDRFVLFSTSAVSEDVIDRLFWSEGDWFGDGEALDPKSYFQTCPVTRHVLDAGEPFFWTKTRGPAGERYRVVARPHGPGLHGLQVPVFGPSGLEGAASFGGERIDASGTVRLALTLLGDVAFRAARRLIEASDPDSRGRLSAREREVLRWTASGRRQTDIAATLGLSERTVENHLRRTRQRLGAATTAQAVRIAIRIGEIEG